MCVVFRSLSRRDIGVVVDNGSPFLFTNGFDSVRRLKAFLAGGESNVSLYDFFLLIFFSQSFGLLFLGK